MTEKMDRYNLGITNEPTAANGGYAHGSPFPWPADRVEEYTAYRIEEPLAIDGHLDEPAWQRVPRSPRFADMVSGAPGPHDTRAAVLWDRQRVYAAFWVEEPNVQADMTERDDVICKENDVEWFIAGRDAYYELEINARGTIYEVFFVWNGEYDKIDYGSRDPSLKVDAEGARDFPGVGFRKHPRGPRRGFWKYDLPGLEWGTHIDGTLNDSSDRDRGWTVELAVPWEGLALLAEPDGRSLPPRDGDVWRMDFSRFNTYRQAPPCQDSGGQFWSPHGERDSHIPELFPIIRFSEELLPGGA